MCRFIIVRRAEEELLSVAAEHDAEETAKKDAAQWAELQPGVCFEVYQILGSAMLEPRVVWKGAKP